MKYALVGGWGYLGVNLVDRLPSCVIARRSSAKKRPFLKKYFENAEVYLLNELTEEELKAALSKCGADVLLYLVGKLKGSREEMYDAHVTKALTSLKVAEELGMKYIYTSSVAAMGIAERCADENLVVREEEEHLKGCEPVGPYSETKMIGEKEVLKRNPSAGIIRPALIWGERYYHPEQKLFRILKRYGIPWPNASVSTIPCIIKGIEESLKTGGWYLTVDTDLRGVGLRAFDWRPSISLIRRAPGIIKVALVPMRYRYASRKLRC
ncbi:MAG: NAD-dependent epimerase/dehydratase family protein [Crenarchaeota archaeon]|nr:NAD-dependent epimerase/dehydratase family protein [Thermoproteota archaeon]